VINVRPAEQYRPIHPPARFAATLVERRPITHDIEEFQLQLDREMQFEPGQYALLFMPGVAGARAYSMSNLPDGSRVLHFQVKRVPAGKGTGVLFDELPVGARVGIDGPYGMAYLRRDVRRDILCIAGGSGLAPMISIARGAMIEPALEGVQLHFLYGGRTALDVCGEDLLEVLPGWKTRLYFEAAISAAMAQDDPPWTGHRGFVHDVAKARFGEKLADMEIYFAGPPAMGAAIQKLLVDHKVPPGQIHFDQFY
jgi:toluene monooxygenase electron transfer component